MSRRKTGNFWKQRLSLYQIQIKVRAIEVKYNFCPVFNICSEQKGFPFRKF